MFVFFEEWWKLHEALREGFEKTCTWDQGYNVEADDISPQSAGTRNGESLEENSQFGTSPSESCNQVFGNFTFRLPVSWLKGFIAC